MSLSTLGLVSKGLLIAECTQARCPPRRDIMAMSNARLRPDCFCPSFTLHCFLPLFYLVSLSCPHFMRYCEDGHFGWKVARSLGQWSVPSIRLPGSCCLLMMISLEPGAHTHSCCVASSRAACLPGCTGDSPCHRGVWCLVQSGLCVTSVCLRAAKGVGEMEHDLPSNTVTPPFECVFLMNSSVTQLIAKNATNLAVAPSPSDLAV